MESPSNETSPLLVEEGDNTAPSASDGTEEKVESAVPNGEENGSLLKKPKKKVTYSSHVSSLTNEGGDDPDTAESERSIHKTYSELTQSIRQEKFPEQGVGLAAFFLRDALLGTNSTGLKTYNPYSTEYTCCGGMNSCRSRFSLFSRKMLTYRWFQGIVKFSSIALIIISFIEPPTWCYGFRRDLGTNQVDPVNTSDVHDKNSVAATCMELLEMRGPPAFATDGDEDPNDVEYYPNFHTVYLSFRQSRVLESILLAIFVLHFLFSLGLDGMSFGRYFDASTGERTVRFFRLLAILGIAYGLLTADVWEEGRPPLYWRIIIYISFSKRTRHELKAALRLGPDLAKVFLLFFLVLGFYGWIGVVAFYESEEGLQHFPNLVEGMWTLWIMATTANYPDVMMPSYNKSRLSVIFFVSYMVVSFYGLMNVILASVVNTYSREADKEEEAAKAHCEEKLSRAFECLDTNGEGRIGRDTVMAIFLLLNEDCPKIRYVSPESAQLFFAILDKDGSGLITEEEFKKLGHVMHLRFERADSYKTFIERHFPNTFRSPWFRRLRKAVKSDKFEMMIDGVLILNAVVVAIQSFPQLVGQTSKENPKIADGEIDTIWEVAESVFTLIYCIEMILKILVLGRKRYMKSNRNVFDGLITILTVAATAYVYYPNKFSDSRLIRYIVMARVLRLLRVLIAVPHFQVIGRTFVDILPAASRIFQLLFCISFAFSALGMHLYGGYITRDPFNPVAMRLEGTDFADNDYWANNFNDLLSGMNVLFNLLVVNNWPEQSCGLVAVKESKWPRIFFVLFHIVGVIVVNNLVIAFVIDSFMNEYEARDERAPEAEGVSIDENAQAVFDASEVTGTKTNLKGEYIAMLRVTDHTKAMKRNSLHKLFTRISSNQTSSDDFQNLGLSERSDISH